MAGTADNTAGRMRARTATVKSLDRRAVRESLVQIIRVVQMVDMAVFYSEVGFQFLRV
jgi:hypothetical protein